jgi:N-acetylglucosamine kinase-like BadF-type ATPase
MTDYVVGVDGGTTKTIALVADREGRIVGAARGGNSNWTGTDVTVPMRVVADTVREALQAAEVQPGDVRVGVFGLAGADWPEDYERREAALTRAGIAQRVIVQNDAIVGWRAGTRRRYGVVIAAGTGSNTCVVAPGGETWCYGYFVLYGGGGDVAREAIHAVLRAEDGRGQPTQLTPWVLQTLGFPTPEQLLRGMVAGRIERTALLALCPLVFRAAHAGDPVAADILVKQGEALAEYATALIRRYEMQTETFDLVLAGSVFKGEGPLLIDTIAQAVHRVAPRVRIVRAALEPAVGALLLAYDALDVPVTDAMRQRLVETTPDPSLFATTASAPDSASGLEFRDSGTWIQKEEEA